MSARLVAVVVVVVANLVGCAGHAPAVPAYAAAVPASAPAPAPVVSASDAAPVDDSPPPLPPPPASLTHIDDTLDGPCEEFTRLAIIADYTGLGRPVRMEALRRIVSLARHETEAAAPRRDALGACFEANVPALTRAVRALHAYEVLFALMSSAPRVIDTARLGAALEGAPGDAPRGTFPRHLLATLDAEARALLIERALFPRTMFTLDDVVSGRVHTPSVLRDALVDALVRDEPLETIRAILGRLRAADPDDLLAFVVARGLDEPSLDPAARRARVLDFVVLVTPARGCAEAAAYARLFAADAQRLVPWLRLAFAEVLRRADRAPDATRALATLVNAPDAEAARLGRLVSHMITDEDAARRTTRSSYFDGAAGDDTPAPPRPSAACASLSPEERAALTLASPTGDALASYRIAAALPSPAALACFMQNRALSAVEREVIENAIPADPGAHDVRALARAAERMPFAFSAFVRVFLRSVLAAETLPDIDESAVRAIAGVSARQASETGGSRPTGLRFAPTTGTLATVFAAVQTFSEGEVEVAAGHFAQLARSEREARAARELFEIAAILYGRAQKPRDAARMLEALTPSDHTTRLAALVAALARPRDELGRHRSRQACFPPQSSEIVTPMPRSFTLVRTIPPLGVGAPRRMCRMDTSAPLTSDTATELRAYLDGQRSEPDLMHAPSLGVLQRLLPGERTPSLLAFAAGDIDLAEAYAEDDERMLRFLARVRAELTSGALARADLTPVAVASSLVEFVAVARRNPRSIVARAHVLMLGAERATEGGDALPPDVRRAVVTMANAAIEDSTGNAVRDALDSIAAVGDRRELMSACARVRARLPDLTRLDVCDGGAP